MFRKKKIKPFQKWLFSGALILLLQGCQKDDICPEGTITTPLLIIEFLDEEDITRLKAAQNLRVQATGMEEVLLGPITTNSISIPLRTNGNTTEYSFTIYSGSDRENTDVVSFSYDSNPQYINRACGYRAVFNNIEVMVHDDEDNWILSEIILQDNIEDETEAHISFTH